MDDPFRILGLPRRFDLTPAEVATAHLRAVSRLHPDRATDSVQREQFVREAAAAGAAKQRLMHETLRAEELLELLGARHFLAAPLSPAFLMETLELRESIEEACAAPGDPRRTGLREQVDSLRAAELEAMAAAFSEALRASADSRAASQGGVAEVDGVDALRRAAQATVRLRYLDRMQTRLVGDL